MRGSNNGLGNSVTESALTRRKTQLYLASRSLSVLWPPPVDGLIAETSVLRSEGGLRAEGGLKLQLKGVLGLPWLTSSGCLPEHRLVIPGDSSLSL